jgi:hypothetical protein
VSNRKPILCVDFDGVIHSYKSGWQGPARIDDEPVPGAIQFLYEALQAFRVCIFSSRSNSQAGIDAMQNYVALHAAKYTGYVHDFKRWWEDIEYPTNKPSAFVTLDDRALNFSGVWPSISLLLNFKPWHEWGPQNATSGTGEPVQGRRNDEPEIRQGMC